MRTQQQIEERIQRLFIAGHREFKEGRSTDQVLSEIVALSWVLYDDATWPDVAQAVRQQALDMWAKMSKNHDEISKIAEVISRVAEAIS